MTETEFRMFEDLDIGGRMVEGILVSSMAKSIGVATSQFNRMLDSSSVREAVFDLETKYGTTFLFEAVYAVVKVGKKKGRSKIVDHKVNGPLCLALLEVYSPKTTNRIVRDEYIKFLKKTYYPEKEVEPAPETKEIPLVEYETLKNKVAYLERTVQDLVMWHQHVISGPLTKVTKEKVSQLLNTASFEMAKTLGLGLVIKGKEDPYKPIREYILKNIGVKFGLDLGGYRWVKESEVVGLDMINILNKFSETIPFSTEVRSYLIREVRKHCGESDELNLVETGYKPSEGIH